MDRQRPKDVDVTALASTVQLIQTLFKYSSTITPSTTLSSDEFQNELIIVSHIVILFISCVDSQLLDGNPLAGLVCSLINCGQGTCVPSNCNGSVLPFDCVCNSGWKKVRVGNITIPTCIVPNCTVDFGCGSPSPPPPALPSFPNLTDPCAFTWCGDGTCVAQGSNHICQCNKGEDNLFNQEGQACFQECAFDGDSNGVGFKAEPPTFTNSGTSRNGLLFGPQLPY